MREPEQKDTFGEYLAWLRRENGKTLRKTAEQIGVSPQYLSQVEHNKALPLSSDRLMAFSRYLGLKTGELTLLFDKAASGRKFKSVPEDCLDYVKNTPSALQALRIAKDKGYGEKEWLAMIEHLQNIEPPDGGGKE